MKKFEYILHFIGGSTILIGLGGLAGYTDTGKGFLISLITLLIGIYSCIWSMRLERERRKREYFRIHRISNK